MHLPRVLVVDRLAGRLLRDRGELLDECRELRVALGVDLCRVRCQLAQQGQVRPHVGSEPLHREGGCVLGMLARIEDLLDVSLVLRGRKLPEELLAHDIPAREGVEEGLVLANHSAGGAPERLGRRLEALEQRRSKQPDERRVLARVAPARRVALGLVARHAQERVPVLGHQDLLQAGEEAGQHRVQVVADRRGHGLRESDRRHAPVGPTDHVTRVVLRDEAPRALDRRGVDDRVEQVRAQVEGVGAHGVLEALADREHPALGEPGVLFHEEAEQVVEVPERVVDGRRREHQEVASLAGEEPPQDCGALSGVGVAVVVGLVHDNERVVVERVLEVLLFAAELGVVRQLLVGKALDEELVVVQEPLPGRIAQRRGANEEHSLAPLAVVADDLAGREGLSEPHAVGDHDTAVFGEDLPRPPHAVLLERRDRDPARLLLLLLQLGVVEVPEDLEVDEIRRHLGEQLRVDRREVEGRGVPPERLEPLLDARDQRVLVVAEHQLEVGPEPGAREVRGPGEDAPLGAAEEERLGVQEVSLVAAHLDPARAQEVEEVPDRVVLVEDEGQEVAVALESAFELRELLAHAAARELRLRRVVGRAPRKQRLGCRVGPEQQPDARDVPRLIRDQLEPLRVEIAACHAQLGGRAAVAPQRGEVCGDRAGERVPVAVVHEDGLDALPAALLIAHAVT